ncbi:MAG: DUF2442 domain-containing protein [Spirochaetaceae bacterium]|nr:DUF2442 domain-containing protein [Spirochaetaceae bacterium]
MNVEAVEDYKIKLNYENGEIKMFNVLPYITGSWYKELYDYGYFKTIHIISDGKGIEWKHGQDIAPHELYEMSIPAN